MVVAKKDATQGKVVVVAAAVVAAVAEVVVSPQTEVNRKLPM